MVADCKHRNQTEINLHTALPFGIGTTELGFVKAIHAPPTVLFAVAAFADSTPAGAITKRSESFTLCKARWLLDLGDLWIGQARTVWLRRRPDICNKWHSLVKNTVHYSLFQDFFGEAVDSVETICISTCSRSSHSDKIKEGNNRSNLQFTPTFSDIWRRDATAFMKRQGA